MRRGGDSPSFRKILLEITLLVLPSLVLAQNRDRVLEAAREVMAEVRYCALITVDEQGYPRARTMDPFEPTEQFTIWFGTNRETRKVGEIRQSPRVTLYYFQHDPPAYVTIIGKAKLVEDESLRLKYWKKAWTDFYEDDNRGEDYLLIEVSPETLEIVSYEHGIAADPDDWGPVVVRFPQGETE